MRSATDEREAIAAVTRVGPFRWLGAEEQGTRFRQAQAVEVIAAYEANVTTERLTELLAQRGPGVVIPTAPVGTREESRPCAASCGRPIEPGQAYVVEGPYHVGCSPRR